MTSLAPRPLTGPAELTARAALAAMADGSLSAEDLMRACLARIHERDRVVRAFIDLHAEEALAAAIAADRAPMAERGLLHGLPVAVKEVFDVAGMRCPWGSPIHAGRTPAEDAECVRRLKAAGAIIVGTVVSTEYAIAAAGPTTNPHDPSRTPGGSSSGAAAAVASAMVPLAVGTQTVGSIVRPAAYCGVFGLKPTHGASPLTGIMPLSPPLDHVGILARDPADLQLAAQVLFGPFAGDPVSRDIAPPEAIEIPKALRVLVNETPVPQPVSATSRRAVATAANRLAAAGASLEPFAFPASYRRCGEVLDIILCRDMALAHGGDRDRAGAQMSDTLRSMIDRGRTTTIADYDAALATARAWRDELGQLISGDTVLISPATDDVAPPLKDGTGSNAPQALWSLVGLPVMAVPAARASGLPVGVQIAASDSREDLLLAVAAAASLPA